MLNQFDHQEGRQFFDPSTAFLSTTISREIILEKKPIPIFTLKAY
jgi:hypothetical protein